MDAFKTERHTRQELEAIKGEFAIEVGDGKAVLVRMDKTRTRLAWFFARGGEGHLNSSEATTSWLAIYLGITERWVNQLRQIGTALRLLEEHKANRVPEQNPTGSALPGRGDSAKALPPTPPLGNGPALPCSIRAMIPLTRLNDQPPDKIAEALDLAKKSAVHKAEHRVKAAELRGFQASPEVKITSRDTTEAAVGILGMADSIDPWAGIERGQQSLLERVHKIGDAEIERAMGTLIEKIRTRQA
jgi:hypothetical protein